METETYTYVCAIDEKGLHTYTPESKQNRKVKEIYEFGQRFISDSDEQINGDFMAQTKPNPNADANKKSKKKNKVQQTNSNPDQTNDPNQKSD